MNKLGLEVRKKGMWNGIQGRFLVKRRVVECILLECMHMRHIIDIITLMVMKHVMALV
jgi:hypothetical protein